VIAEMLPATSKWWAGYFCDNFCRQNRKFWM